jgi:hypothetical protein
MSYQPYRPARKDMSDCTAEKHCFVKQEYVKSAGSIVKVLGTDTEDEEACVVNNGSSFNLKKDTDAEVFLLGAASDTQLKQAMLSIPKDKQRRWQEGDGGVQHPTDPEFALDFSDHIAHVTQNKFGVGKDGEFEVKGKEGYFRVTKLIVDGELIVNKRIKTPQVVVGSEPPPGFKGNTQMAESGSGGGGTPTMAAVQLDLFSAQLEMAL